MTLPKNHQPPSSTPDDAKPAISPNQSIDDIWEEMEEYRMDKILKTLEDHQASAKPSDSPPS